MNDLKLGDYLLPFTLLSPSLTSHSSVGSQPEERAHFILFQHVSLKRAVRDSPGAPSLPSITRVFNLRPNFESPIRLPHVQTPGNPWPRKVVWVSRAAAGGHGAIHHHPVCSFHIRTLTLIATASLMKSTTPYPRLPPTSMDLTDAKDWLAHQMAPSASSLQSVLQLSCSLGRGSG